MSKTPIKKFLEFDSEFLIGIGDNSVLKVFEIKNMRLVTELTLNLYESDEDINDI
jgi:hypothetical protein